MQFLDELAGGIILIRPALRSPNYMTGSTGWTINQDGTAEFADLTIRSSDGSNSTVIIANGEIEIRDGSNNLEIEINATGVTTYGNRGGIDYVNRMTESLYEIGEVGQANPGLIGYTSLGGGQYALEIESGGDAGTGSSEINLYSETGVGAGDSEINLLASLIEFHGNVAAIATYAGNAFTTYTPTVTGGGAVTWTTRTGWWQRVGKMIFFNAYLVVNVAGSGALNVAITAPTNIDRTIRQTVFVSGEGLTAGNSGSLALTAFTGGAGATFDRLRNSAGTNITGAALAAGADITVTGWYREA
ncbi:hypothetical protein ABZ208_37505 [Streptomyces sp. NPDC006208]|uniref:hypothetical protein n=1 Tax=Streptomyces sp. NPDC006208 TaxID=3156734 RepID=UPI0033A8D529